MKRTLIVTGFIGLFSIAASATNSIALEASTFVSKCTRATAKGPITCDTPAAVKTPVAIQLVCGTTPATSNVCKGTQVVSSQRDGLSFNATLTGLLQESKSQNTERVTVAIQKQNPAGQIRTVSVGLNATGKLARSIRLVGLPYKEATDVYYRMEVDLSNN